MFNWRVFEYRRFMRIFEKNAHCFNAYEVASTLTDIGMMITFELQSENPNSRLVKKFNDLTIFFADLIETRVK